MLMFQECKDNPGFVAVFRSPSTSMNVLATPLEYENYRHVVYKWLYSLTKASIIIFTVQIL